MKVILGKERENEKALMQKFKEQVRDENLKLRLEQMEEENIYELFEAFEQYDHIYR